MCFVISIFACEFEFGEQKSKIRRGMKMKIKEKIPKLREFYEKKKQKLMLHNMTKLTSCILITRKNKDL